MFTLYQFVIAMPTPGFVWGAGVPLFPAIKATAVSADDTARKDRYALSASTCRLTSAELLLYLLKDLRLYNGRMVFGDIENRQLPGIFLHLVIHERCGKTLL